MRTEFLAGFTIRLATPSGNQTLRQHWAVRAKERKAWETRVLVAAAISGAIKYRAQAPTKRMLRISRYGARYLDLDNCIAGMKMLIDACKSLRLIWDDSPKFLTLDVRQLPANGSPHTEVEIYDERTAEGETRDAGRPHRSDVGALPVPGF